MGCPNGHYTRVVTIVCYTSDPCTCTLRILRAASTHFPVLRKFLSHVNDALSAHKIVCDIDSSSKMVTSKG